MKVALARKFGWAAVLAHSLGCNEPCSSNESGPRVRLEVPGTGHFFDHPWPSNARRTPSGQLAMLGFPNASGSTTLSDYLEAFQRHTNGFGLNAAIYASFTEPLDPTSLPKEPLDASTPNASLRLIDIDPNSPERGRTFPLEVRFAEPPTSFLPANHLSALPPYGIPLRSATTYALVGNAGIKSKSGESIVAPDDLSNALIDGCEGETSSSFVQLFAPLRAFLEAEDIEPEDVRAATVFTTQDVIGEMRLVAERAVLEPTPTLTNLRHEVQDGGFGVWSGEIMMPAFQRGEPPYGRPEDGGDMTFSGAGPEVTHHEPVRVSIAVPSAPTPADGWPVVLYAHGTYGSYTSVVDEGLAKSFAALGIAAVGFDQTLHGPRDPTAGDPGLSFFNLFNIVAGRDNVRQGGVDGVVMTKLIKELSIPTADFVVKFDPERIAFLGHSQGGISGAPFVAIEKDLKAAVFSGTSGILAIAVQERTDPINFLGLLRSLLDLEENEVVDDHHPIISIVQTFIDPGDPINYARTYLTDPAGNAPRDVLFIEGFKDFASPARGHEALASAAGAPVIAPAHRVPRASQLIGLEPQGAPATANVEGPSGRVTFGLIQYPEQDHWPLFEDPDANHRGLEFLRTALFEGRARIDAP